MKKNKEDINIKEKEIENEENKANEISEELKKEIIKDYNKKTSIQRIVAIICALAVYIILSIFLKNAANNNFLGSSVEKKEKISKSGEIDDEEIKKLKNTLEGLNSLIDQKYLNKKDLDRNKQLIWAIKGYVAGLGDEYTSYMTKEEYLEFINNLDGKLVGIGVAMQKTEEGVKLVKVFDESPAKLAGIKEGDVLLEANGEDLTEFSLDEISKKVRGEEGSIVKIKVLRGSDKLDFEVKRKLVNIKYVSGKMLENNVGYIKLEQFGEEAYKMFKEEYDKLKKAGMKKLVLDLRGNTGGELENAKSIINMFLPKNQLIFSTRDSNDKRQEEKTTENQISNEKLVILGDGYSASASELMIGALIDNKRATFVGKNTYGKGVIQELKTLPNGDFLKLTTHEYLRPNGETINKKGIKPDVEVDLNVDEYKKNGVDTQLNKALEIINNE